MPLPSLASLPEEIEHIEPSPESVASMAESLSTVHPESVSTSMPVVPMSVLESLLLDTRMVSSPSMFAFSTLRNPVSASLFARQDVNNSAILRIPAAYQQPTTFSASRPFFPVESSKSGKKRAFENEDAQPALEQVTSDGPYPPPEDASDEMSEYLWSTLGLSQHEKFTDQQVALEKASLTDSERTEALSDLFGRISLVGIQDSKKPRQDVDSDSSQFLVAQMWIEIGALPADETKVLMEAKEKAPSGEFDEDRLAHFLRCEGLDPKLAARRFARYWKARKDLFGEEKYLLPMKLSGAFKDDLEALEQGMYCMLPHCDLNGRQMILWEPSRHTREGYSSESMVRTGIIW